ncbi:MAG TPA: EamA family transporter RarD [Tepidisphaeraceae bacterium]|jgi:chloramphenicol-sensitive protein RarD
MTDRSKARNGILLGAGGYVIWGLAPIYFHQFRDIPTIVVICHRVIWSFCIFWLLLTLLPGARAQVRAALHWKTIGVLVLSTCLLATTWFFFVYLIEIGKVMQVSMGYFILPLITCALGMIFLKEQLRKLQYASVGLAACGVTAVIVASHQVPTMALVMAASFGAYGFVRKIVPVGALVGMAFEMSIMLPAALIIVSTPMGRAASAHSTKIFVLLLCAGLVTATPLLMFTKATRILRLTSLSFCQYVGPTCQLLTALFYREPFTRVHAISFGFIWCGLVIYSVDSWRAGRDAELAEAALEPE